MAGFNYETQEPAAIGRHIYMVELSTVAHSGNFGVIKSFPIMNRVVWWMLPAYGEIVEREREQSNPREMSVNSKDSWTIQQKEKDQTIEATKQTGANFS